MLTTQVEQGLGFESCYLFLCVYLYQFTTQFTCVRVNFPLPNQGARARYLKMFIHKV
jgi:hypothetical protein